MSQSKRNLWQRKKKLLEISTKNYIILPKMINRALMSFKNSS